MFRWQELVFLLCMLTMCYGKNELISTTTTEEPTASIYDDKLRGRQAIKTHADESDVNGTMSFKVENYEFIFYLDYRVSWKRAQELCPKLSPGSVLAEVPRKELMQYMSLAVCSNDRLLNYTRNLWLGATFDGTEWYWEKEDTPIPVYTTSDGYPPWHPELPEFYETCLSMAVLPKPVRRCSYYFVGDHCNHKNGFVCRRDIPHAENDSSKEPDDHMSDEVEETIEDWKEELPLEHVHEKV